MERKNISVVMRCMIVCILLSVRLIASAVQIWIDDFRYIVLSEEDRTVAVDLMKDVSRNKQEFVIPDIVNIDGIEYTVTTIRKITPRFFSGEISLTVPATVKYIEERAFASFFDLRHIEFECDRLEEVGKEAFNYCSALSSFDFSKLPTDPDKLGDGIFSRTGIKEVNWPAELKTIPSETFYNSAIERINIEGSELEEVGDYAFRYCKNLSSFDFSKLPADPDKIGYGIFYETGFKEVNWPAALKIIPRGIFSYTPIEKINIECDRLEYVGEEAFSYCKELTAFDFSKLPSDPDKLGGGIFSGTYMREINWPADIRTIPSKTFYDSAIERINIECDRLEYIGEYAFANCRALSSFDFSKLPTDSDKLGYGIFYNTSFKEVTWPAELKIIPDGIFKFTPIEQINIECDRLEYIGKNAFANCSALTSFDFSKLPSDPEKVGNQVFFRSGITDVEWPEHLPVVPEKMFFYSAVTNLKLPPTLTTVSTAAFAWCKIDTLSIPANILLMEQAFACNFDLKELRLGEGCLLYSTCLSYNSDLEKIVLPSGTRIYGCPFFDMLNLRELELAADVHFYNGAQLLARDDEMAYYLGNNPFGYYSFPSHFGYEEDYGSDHGYDPHVSISPVWKQDLKKVIYHTDAPQYIGDYDIVRQKDYDTATLYVEPKGLNRARVINPWKNFHNIAPLDIVTGIENTDLDSAEEAGAESGGCGYYTLSGVYVGDNFDSLSRGVYICRTTDGVRKIIK